MNKEILGSLMFFGLSIITLTPILILLIKYNFNVSIGVTLFIFTTVINIIVTEIILKKIK
jgi:hypothetical protein